MRIAVLSDIHGNSIALEAVLEDIRVTGGADAYWILGDLAAFGPDPVACLERLNSLPNAIYVRGNTDRWACNWVDPKAATDAAGAYRLAMLSWAQGVLTASGWWNWLSTLGLEQRVSLPDGTRALLVHAAPGKDDGAGLHPGLSDEEWAHALEGCDADLIFVGHTHWPLDRQVGSTRVLNLGSLSIPFGPDVRACYVLLECDESSHRAEHRRVAYDVDELLAQMNRLRFPGTNFLTTRFRGEIVAPWG
ncbi:MAG: metallophosphoesterase family protein [Chloroflexi bacterium]|nr:metallophosphoesterase family protein [Chloroflexota bacterium]